MSHPLPLKFLCWSPNIQCDGIWRWKVIRFRWNHEVGAPLMGYVPAIRRGRDQNSPSQPCADTARSQSSANQKVAPHRTSNLLLAPWSWTSQPPELREINIYCLSHPVCGICYWIRQEVCTVWNDYLHPHFIQKLNRISDLRYIREWFFYRHILNILMLFIISL